MRVGSNPARLVQEVAQPAEITVTVVNCIPFLSGYYEQSLEVLKAVVESLNDSREEDHPFDVMIFDNHSCADVRSYLQSAEEQGKIQYLVLSDKNIGKIGAWNYMFGAAQGKYVVFADGDIYFRPGWLSASLDLISSFPKVGMVTARPLRTPGKYSQATFLWGQQQGEGVYQEGKFLDWDVYLEHTDSIGITREIARKDYENDRDHLLTFQGHCAYIGATHFQFLTRKDVLAKIMPLPSEQPMRGERAFDIAVDALGYLRLCTEKPLVMHMGNRLPAGLTPSPPPRRKHPGLKRVAHLPGVRNVLLWLYNQIFQIFFHDVD